MEKFVEEHEKSILRELVWFTKKRGKLVGVEELIILNILDLRKIFNVTDSFYKDETEPYDEAYDPYMSYAYDVDEKKAKALQPYIKHKIRLDKYDYQIDASQRPLPKDA